AEGPRFEDADIPPVLVLPDTLLLAVDADLLHLDPTTGHVLARTRYPASIHAIAPVPDDPRSATLTLEGGLTTPHPLDGRTVHQWAWEPSFRSVSVSRSEAQRQVATMTSAGLGARDRAALLDSATATDPTNVLLHIERAAAWAEAGDDSRAAQARTDATGHPDLPWFDLLLASAALRGTGHDDLADTALANAREAMAAHHVDTSRFVGIMPLPILTSALREPLERAVATRDTAELERLLGWLANLFPHVEGANEVFTAVADFCRDAGDHDCAERFGHRADRAATHGFGSLERDTRRADLALLAMLALGPAAALAALLLGLRSGRRRRAENTTGRAAWTPALRIGEAIPALLAAALLVPLFLTVAATLLLIQTWVTAPMGVGHDSLAAPNVEAWLLPLADTPERDALLTLARADAEAFRDGTAPPPRTEALPILLRDAVRAGQADALARVDRSVLLHGLSGLRAPSAPAVGILMLIALLLGHAIGRFLPGIATLLRRIVPGGSGWPAPVELLVLAAAMAAFFGFLELHQLILVITMPDPALYYGLPEGFSPPLLSGPPAWAWGLLAAVAVMHAVGLWRSKASGEERED
ncbi:MAG: hypothetical protein EA398_17225, partial [Deltaproteobacteria bacterium]